MLKSMTAFARQDDSGDWGNAIWEIRAVNHRYFDLSLRLPEQLRSLEGDLREIAKPMIQRGKVDCSLRYTPGSALDVAINVNESLAKSLIKANQQVDTWLDNPKKLGSIDILRWPGVIQVAELDLEQLKAPILASYKQALADLCAAREREGASLKQAILTRLEQLEQGVVEITKVVPEVVQQNRQKLLDRLAEIQQELDPARLEQELVLLAQKQDIQEEIDRLNTHVQEVKLALEQEGSVGRRLDFLMQELNREANTVASKTVSMDVSKVALDLKVFIEQMREQVQNIE